MLTQSEIKCLEHNLLDYNEWATNAVDKGIFKDVDTALKYKITKCKQRMLHEYESRNGKVDNQLTDDEKVSLCVNEDGYKNRSDREPTII
jgi:hypothetical protein